MSRQEMTERVVALERAVRDLSRALDFVMSTAMVTIQTPANRFAIHPTPPETVPLKELYRRVSQASANRSTPRGPQS
jgi:hypothetical protein